MESIWICEEYSSKATGGPMLPRHFRRLRRSCPSPPMPALYSLKAQGVLSEAFGLIGVARADKSEEAFRSEPENGLRHFANSKIDDEIMGLIAQLCQLHRRGCQRFCDLPETWRSTLMSRANPRHSLPPFLARDAAVGIRDYRPPPRPSRPCPRGERRTASAHRRETFWN
jgi:hypothetical protein